MSGVPLLWRQDLLLNPKFIDWQAGWLGTYRDLPVLISSVARVTDVCHLAFYVSFVNLDSGPDADRASMLPTKPSSLPS